MPEHLRSKTDPIDPSQHDEAPPGLLRRRIPARAALLAGLTCLGLALAVGAGWASDRSSPIVDVSQPTKTVAPHAAAISTSTPLPLAPRPTLHAAACHSLCSPRGERADPERGGGVITGRGQPAVRARCGLPRDAGHAEHHEAQQALDLLAQVEAADPTAAARQAAWHLKPPTHWTCSAAPCT